MKLILGLFLSFCLFSCNLPLVKKIKISGSYLNNTKWICTDTNTNRIFVLSFKNDGNSFKAYYVESETDSIEQALKDFEYNIQHYPQNCIFSAEIKNNDYVLISLGNNDYYKVSFYSDNSAHFEIVLSSGQAQLDYWFKKYQ